MAQQGTGDAGPGGHRDGQLLPARRHGLDGILQGGPGPEGLAQVDLSPHAQLAGDGPC